jgi:tetratricopeptide (TPR) repeat protein
VAQEERDFQAAREWYLKSLAIEEKQGNLHGAAISYHQLGMVAQEERDFKAAREWYLKSLAIKEQQGNLHGAASTYGQLGIVAALEGDMVTCGAWLARCIRTFLETSDTYAAERNVKNFLLAHQGASPESRLKMEAAWHEAGLGPFPPKPEQ